MVTLNKIGEKQFRLLSRNGFDVKIKEWTIYCCDLALWSEQNLNMDFTWSYGRIQQHIAPNSVLHVLHDCFSSFNEPYHWFVALFLPSETLRDLLHSRILPAVPIVFT